MSDFVSMSKNILDVEVDVQQSPDGLDESVRKLDHPGSTIVLNGNYQFRFYYYKILNTLFRILVI